MFNITDYEYDEDHNYLEIGGEAMIFHCHHYILNLQRTILDAKYINSRTFLVGAAADSVYYQLQNLCENLSIQESKRMVEDVYKAFGYGIIELSRMDKDGITLKTSKSFFSNNWLNKFGKSVKPVDYYTVGFLAAAYCVIYGKKLKDVYAIQQNCISCGDKENIFIVKDDPCNFKVYSPKNKTKFNETPKESLNWEHEEKITNTFLGAHANFVGDENGTIYAFGVYLVRNQSDYVNRLQFEFADAMREITGDYGVTLAGELLMEAGHACGFFTYGGILTSSEWKKYVQPLLHTKEDWIKALISLINTMGWGYHTVVELSEEKAIFRNYNDFEDLSYLRMYGKSDYFIHWANSGGFTGLMELVYKTNIINDGVLETEEGFLKMRSTVNGYKTKMTKGIACGDDYLEVQIWK